MRVTGFAAVALASFALVAPALPPRADAPLASAVDGPRDAAEPANQDAASAKQDEAPVERAEPPAKQDAALDALKHEGLRSASVPATRRPLALEIHAATAATATENNARGPGFEAPRWGDQAGIDFGAAASELHRLVPRPPPRRETATRPDADR